MGDMVMLERRNFPTIEQAETALCQVYRDQWPVLVGQTQHELTFRMEDMMACRPTRDPYLQENLQRIFGLNLAQAAGYRRFTRSSERTQLLCLQHTWGLAALAEWLNRRHPADPAPILLHIDAHDDLQRPSILSTASPRQYRALVGNSQLDLGQQASVTEFIERGWIGIGGFLTPFLHALREGYFVHIHPPDKDTPMRASWLQTVIEPLVYFGGYGDCPTVAMMHTERAQTGMMRAYTATDLTVLDVLPKVAPVLLDLDLDFFCNAYDDSRQDHPPLPSVPELRAQMTHFLTELSERLAGRLVELVIIAFSPNFFPSVFWEESLVLLNHFFATGTEWSRQNPMGVHV